MASISLKGVQKAYGEAAPVIRDVDLEIGAHEFCVFLGPSGCGKSTLLRMIAGLEDVSDGEIAIGGRRVNELSAAQRGVAMVFQSYALFPHMTVYENIAFGLRLAKTPKAEIDRKVREAARILQLEPLLERHPKALSGGQRQRVAIGRAIVREPGVFLFDEPLSNLDATLRGQTRIEIGRLHRQFAEASVVYVTHDQVEAMTLADKIVLLHSGEDTERYGSIAQVGAPLDLYYRPASRFVAGFIGSPRMNFLAAHVLADDAGGLSVRLDGGGETVRLPLAGAGVAPGDAVTFGIRPEHLECCAADGGSDAGALLLTRRVTLVEALGEHSYVHLEQPDGTLIAKAPGELRVATGDTVRLRAPAASCHLFAADGFAIAAPAPAALSPA
ncbi:sn-glycerol-3-phosphate ABC transporter ATP-binding protein UgpC [Burkholderia glumae]|uniref:ABC transporter ATP-binding protein n=1 Tax=Burkholderia glumae TaxID=337 RepID=UPI00030804B6|nr:sn-glycerol-3-phosphate ABC transporter ATP-binding protein UgpC [Burkholderia glumae]MCM2493189.1 sn-glycerol-3-phosphate ABC transporter ATP-binding protein UgpC [Burkholderia glumae]MCM2544129.1 sn-glycerol-3-phosphate ABC transporter ATP-binding protein UgpC [Burkholderia glumae]MCM2547843.1 sn-glycerol-3-phosphate ABC transporter ATP-binding protein UgpC [Burkholderia glumae]NVE21518.1 sn-glycerol-3-phosphate ABC transporter ATP-binding protein UgpC [Burkholderia glumae]PJO25034.1 ABC 